MKIRTLLSPFILAMAMAGTSLAHADTAKTPVSSVDAAYSEYQREATELEKTLDHFSEFITEGPKDFAVFGTASVKAIEMKIAYQKARHDLALGQYLAEAAAARLSPWGPSLP